METLASGCLFFTFPPVATQSHLLPHHTTIAANCASASAGGGGGDGEMSAPSHLQISIYIQRAHLQSAGRAVSRSATRRTSRSRWRIRGGVGVGPVTQLLTPASVLELENFILL